MKRVLNGLGVFVALLLSVALVLMLIIACVVAVMIFSFLTINKIQTKFITKNLEKKLLFSKKNQMFTKTLKLSMGSALTKHLLWSASTKSTKSIIQS